MGPPRQGDAGEVVIRLSGDLDDVRPPELFAAVARARVGSGTVVLECTALDSLNLEGVAALISLWDGARTRGTRVLIRGAQGRVVEKLRQVGVLGVLSGDGPA